MAKYNPDEDIQNKQESASQSEKIRKARSSGMNERDAILASMRKTPKPSESAPTPSPSVAEAPKEEYPYGLRISLSADELDKLGLDKMPSVGDTFQIKANAKVDSVSESHRTGSDPSKGVDLQITDMHVCEGGSGLDEQNDDEESPEHEASESPEEESEEEKAGIS